MNGPPSAATGCGKTAPAPRASAHFELALFLPAFVFVVVVSLVPFVYALVQSTHRSHFLDLGRFVGVDNFVDFLTDRSGIGKSLLFAAGSLAVTIPLGITFALILNDIVRFRSLVRTILIMPWLLSSVVTGKIWAWLLNGDIGPIAYFMHKVGITMPNAVTSPALAMPTVIMAHAWTAYPLVMVLSLAALQTVPKETLDAARIDGATEFKRLRHVVFPIIKNSILVIVVLTSINAFNHVSLLFVMTGGGPVDKTNVMALRIFTEGFRFSHLGLASAGAVILFALNVVFTFGYVRVLRTERT